MCNLKNGFGWNGNGFKWPGLNGVHPGYFRERPAGCEPKGWEKPPPLAVRAARRWRPAGWAVDYLIVMALAAQITTLVVVRQSQKQVAAEMAAGNLLPAGVTYQTLQNKFRAVGVVLKYLLDVAKHAGGREAAEQHFFGQAAGSFGGQRISDANGAADQPFVDIALRPAVGVISVPVANLRAGPGKEFPVVMTVSEGMRFVIDGYQDGWYSVTAPTGENVWMSEEIAVLNRHPVS